MGKPTPPDVELPEPEEVDLNVDEFRALALDEGWQLKTLKFMCEPPLYSGRFSMGKWLVKVVD